MGKFTRERFLTGSLGRFLGSWHLMRSRRHMVRGEKHIRRDLTRAKDDAEKEDIKKTAGDVKKVGKDLYETLQGEEGILKDTLKFTGQIEEDEQALIDLLDKLGNEGFPPKLSQEEARKLVPIMQNFISELNTDGQAISDLQRKAQVLLNRLRKFD